MIDLKAARQDPDGYRAALDRRGAAADFDALLAVDARWRELTERAESLRAEQKKSSKGGRPGPERLAELRRLADELSKAQAEQADAERERGGLLARIPNLPDPTAADGMAEEDAQVGGGRVGQVRDAREQAGTLPLGVRLLRLRLRQVVGQPPQLRALLRAGRAAPGQLLLLGAQRLGLLGELTPPGVHREQRVEVGGSPAPVQRGPVTVRILPRSLEIYHRRNPSRARPIGMVHYPIAEHRAMLRQAGQPVPEPARAAGVTILDPTAA